MDVISSARPSANTRGSQDSNSQLRLTIPSSRHVTVVLLLVIHHHPEAHHDNYNGMWNKKLAKKRVR